MNPFLSAISNAVTQLGLGKPTASELALLILLGASLLVLRTIHERYFRIWVLGLMALVLSRLAGDVIAARMPADYVPLVVQTAFVLAVGLLAGSVLLYSRTRELILPLAVVTPEREFCCGQM